MLRIRKLTPKELLFYIMGLCGIIDNIGEQLYEKNFREILPILWEEVGKKEIWQEIRRFWGIQQKEILQPNVYEQSILKSWNEYSKDKKCTLHFSQDSREDITNGKCLCDLWESWKGRYTPHRWELSQQQFRQFNDFMSQLPYENSQQKENLQNMWETCQVFGFLQQTLYKIQEIWESTLPQKQSRLRIRKLTPRECMRLMGFTDDDYQALKDIGLSDSAIYHCAGDSIITTCLVSLLSPFVNEEQKHIEIVNNYVEKEIINGD